MEVQGIMENLISLTNAFLTATGLFFAALGAAGTYNEPLKVLLSASALVMSVIWLCTASTLVGASLDTKGVEFQLAILLPSLFVLGWSISLGVHGYRWLKGIKGPVDQHQ